MDKHLKIAVTGVGGVGKTTIVNWLAEKYKLPIVPEFAKETIETPKFPIEETWTDVDKFFEFQAEVINKKLETEIKHRDTGFVADRTLYDCIIFMEFRLARERGKIEKKYSDLYEGFSKACLVSEYDLIFYLTPFSEEIPDDGKRNTNQYYRNIFDTVLLEAILCGPCKNVMLINNATLEERKLMIVKTIDNIKVKP